MIILRHGEPADAPALAEVHARTWREAYWGALPDAVSEDSLYDERYWRDVIAASGSELGRDGAVIVAYDSQDEAAGEGSPLLGFALSGPADRRRWGGRGPAWSGEVFMLYVLDRAQRRGIGGALLSAAMRHLVSRAFFQVGLWCVSDNGPARAFYEAMGGAPAGSRTHTVRGVATPVSGYVWDEHALADIMAGY